jgi:hypothetical protein
MTEKTYCARNYTSAVSLHDCTGGRFCEGNCKPKRKTYIHKLQEENKQLKETIDLAKFGLTELQNYLMSDKFRCGNELDEYVNVKDVQSMINNVQSVLLV